MKSLSIAVDTAWQLSVWEASWNTCKKDRRGCRLTASIPGSSLPSRRDAMDFLVFTPEEIEKWKGAKNHVIAHALKEGRTLYECH